MLNKILYNTVLSQTFSPCGRYLVAGNIYGQLAIFDLERILNPPEVPTAEFDKPKHLHSIESGKQINSLTSTQNFLIVGSVSKICGWDWKHILNTKMSKPSWTIRILSKSVIDEVDVNSLWLSEDECKLYAGCGDNRIYAYDLEDGKLLSTYEGHTDYVHCVHGKGQQLISGGEDGCVFLWDTRSEHYHKKLEPHSNKKVNRPDIGKWIGGAALGDDWFVCGGGPNLALWHLRTFDPVTVFNIHDRGIHVSLLHEDCVFAGGAAKHFYILDFAGDVKVELPVSATTVYSAAMRIEPNKILSIAGSSPEIDLCTSFNYRDQVLHFR